MVYIQISYMYAADFDKKMDTVIIVQRQNPMIDTQMHRHTAYIHICMLLRDEVCCSSKDLSELIIYRYLGSKPGAALAFYANVHYLCYQGAWNQLELFVVLITGKGLLSPCL